MDRPAWLTLLALVATALVAGGAAVRVVALLGSRAATVSLALLAAVLASVVLGTAWSRARASTPYW